MYEVMCKEICAITGVFKKKSVLKYYLEGQDMYFDDFEFYCDHKIVRMNDKSCDNSEYFYFSTVTGKLIHQGLLYMSDLEYNGFIVLSYNHEVFYFSAENNEFIKVAKNIKKVCICKSNEEKSLCLLNNDGEIEIFDFDSLTLSNTIKFSVKINFMCLGYTKIEGDFALKVEDETSKKFYIVSQFKNFSYYVIVNATHIQSIVSLNNKKYYIADRNTLLDHNFNKMYSSSPRESSSLSSYGSYYVIITKKNISGPDTYGLIDLRDGKIVLKPIYNAIIENGNELIGRIYGEDFVIKN